MKLLGILYRSRTHLNLLLFLSLFAISGCGKDAVPTRPPEPDPVPSRMVISPPSGSLTASGQTLQLTATLFDANGSPLTGFEIAWSSSNTAVATVDRNGLVTAHSGGTTQIIAAWGGVRNNITVMVSLGPSRIVVTPESVRFKARGETRQLEAVVLDADDVPIADASVNWSSDNPAVVFVNSRGEVKAITNGEARITATTGSVSKTIVITVAQVPVRIILPRNSVQLASVGETTTLTAIVVDSLDAEILDAPLMWTSEDPTVATVDAQGEVTARMNGETRITVTSGNLSAVVTVNVELQTNRIVVSPESVYLTSIGEMIQLTASVRDADDMEIPGVGLTLTSEDPAVASVDGQGVVTAHMNGETRIVVTWEDLEASVSVVVSQVADRIVVSQQVVHLPSIGDMVNLFATVYDGNNVEIQDADLMWSSEDPTVASVDDQGVVTAHMEGETSITVTSGALSANVRITVVQQANHVVVSPQSVDMTAIGETIQLIATVFDMGDGEVPGAELIWTSEEPTVATVNNQGVVTAQMNGQTLVTVTWKDVSASVTVTVEQQAHRIFAAPQTVHFADAGETKELFVLVIDANDMEIPGAELTWSSENPTVATVDDRGVVTARMEGVTRVTVTSGAISAQVVVIVGTPMTLVVSTESVRLTAIGETFYAIAMVLDAYNQRIPGAELAWVSKDPTVATVDDYGEITAQMNGQTIVTVTWEDMSDSISVTVAQQADSIVVLPQLVRLSSTEDMIELTASVRDANDVEIPGAVLTWTSENPAVASVDEQGVVTAHMLGTTRVTVTSGMVTKSVPVFVGEISSEREILIDFYNATDGPNWRKNTHWLTDQPLEQWHGVDVDSTGRVEEIWLIQNDLEGHIPASLASLSQLKFLNLADNKLSGEIPAALASLSHLEFMRLAQNELSGGIPTGFGNLTLLKTFDLSVNELSGNIPSSLGNLSKLSAIDLQINKLTGEIPSALGNLENLSYLRLAGNPLSGPIPPSLGQLDKLQRLYLSGNGLTGEIPSEFGGLVSLKELHMSGNSLTGEIPAELGNLEHLVSLRLKDNAGLTGPLPRTFLNLNLLHLQLFGTQACIPRDLEFEEWKLSFHSRFALDCEAGPDMIPLEALYYLAGGADWTDNTNWRGAEPISEWFGVSVNDTGRVVGLELPMNGLDGVIPSSLSDLTELIRLNLGNNILTGSIPADLGELENLRELKLHDNPRMSGSLHEELVNLELSTLWLQGTQLCAPGNSNMQTWIQDIADARVADCDPSPTDPMGDRDILVALYNATDGDNWSRNDNWLSDLPLGDWYGIVTGPAGRVHKLEIKSNGLDGTIPSALGSLTELRRIDLYDNSLSGGIPASLGGLSHLEFMFLNGNDLSGSIPSRLGDLSQLRTLSLGGNALTGSIPGQLGNLTNLKALLLSGNGISGEIPASIARLSNLTWLSLGNNDLTGEIPSSLGHISGLTDLYLYNNGLTGDIPSALGNLVALRNLDLSANDLSGGVPSSFGNLEVLLSLKLSNNADLTGPLPSGLINTSLNVLLADGTNLCAPRDQQFLNWLLVVHNRSIPICQLSMEDRETLVAFYNATDGPNWTGISTNWLSNQPIDEWRGVVVDSTGRVSHLILGSVGVSGALPSSLGNLTNLQQLYLARNQLSGNIPTELGNLANLRSLFLHSNELSGNIPSALGRLENLTGLGLDGNMLTGSIPASLGDLNKLTSLYLENNSLSGGIPASLGGLTQLKLLWVHNNTDMSGPLPGALTGMISLDTLRLDGTGLCVPRTDAFQTWLDGIETKQFEYCEADE